MARCRPSAPNGAAIPSAAIELVPPRTYQLLIEIGRALRLEVGRLGTCRFPAGLYCYTGSARRNFEARIERHLRAEKRLHWHIDYLLTAPGVCIREVKRLAEDECEVNRRQVGEIVCPGFGSSDCRSGCGSHLKRIGEMPKAWNGRGREAGPPVSRGSRR